MTSDVAYYERRVCEERNAAVAAVSPEVRDRHLEFAEAYEERLRGMAAYERRSAMHVVGAV